MRIVLVSSPGYPPGPHWSQAAAAALAEALRGHGAEVAWFCVTPSPTVAAPPGAAAVLALRRPPRVARVAAGLQHVALEVALTRALRAEPVDAVVHVGAGAGGSPNVGWLAERMGSAAFAVVRGAEVVCQRGDLVDADGAACDRHDDAERCRACCARGVWFGPRAADLRNRHDLLFAGLAGSRLVFVADAADRAHVAAFGVPAPKLVVAGDAAAIAAQLVAALSPSVV